MQGQEGTALFSGPLEDQATLGGILAKLPGLGLTLLSLETNEMHLQEDDDELY